MEEKTLNWKKGQLFTTTHNGYQNGNIDGSYRDDLKNIQRSDNTKGLPLSLNVDDELLEFKLLTD